MNLQEQYGLIQVYATPTDAALEPGWPQSLFSIVKATYGGIRHFLAPEDISDFWVALDIVLWGLWICEYVIAQTKQATGGWVNVTDFAVTWALLSERELGEIWELGIIVAQCVGTLAIVVQRWHGLGSIAYEIVDDGGCTPVNDFAYLEQGARSRIFRISQDVAFAWAIIVLG